MNTDDCPKGVFSKRDYEIAEKIGRSPEITSWAIDYIQDTLPGFEGGSYYGCDFASYLTDEPNTNGSYIFGKEASWNFISSHVNDARDEYNYEKDNFGIVLHNPFENPEAFVVCMLIDIVEQIMSDVPIVDDHWNEDWEISGDDIKEILTFLGRSDEHKDNVE